MSANKKILCMLPICCYPANPVSNKGKERIQQYVKGLTKFFEYNNILKKHDVDIYLVDNSIKVGDSLPRDILAILPDNVKINTSLNNTFGALSKGAGLIEQWLYCKDIIAQYDWFIHFEPRQLLLNFNFINNFLENPRNLFTLGGGISHFYTGLFCIQINNLLNYYQNIDLPNMISRQISIEYDLYNYFKHNNIQYNILDKMELVWHDIAVNKLFSL
jgi:hypothetical protein